MKKSSTGASYEALFCIGSNCGDRRRNVADALSWLAGILKDCRHSPIYATPDCHGGHREYLNAVCEGKSELSASQMEALCKEYELTCGRDHAAREAGDVPVDVDIVVFDGVILREMDYSSEFFLIGYRDIIHVGASLDK